MIRPTYQLIILPVLLELVGRRKFAARNLQRYLHAAIPDVIVILHATCQRIPGRSIGDAVLKGGRCRFAGYTPRHLGVIAGIDQR